MADGRSSSKGRGGSIHWGRGILLLLSMILAITVLMVAVAGCGGESTTTTVGGGADTGSGTNPTGDPVVIGAIVSATGPNSPLGEPERKALGVMEKEINAAGGVLGRPVVIVVEDDKSDPKEAVTAANRLIQQEKAVAIIAASGSPSTLAVKEITAQQGLPQVSMAASSAITDQAPTEWIWSTPHKNELAVARALTYISEVLQAKKIAVLHDENAFGSDGMKEIEKSAGNFGLEIVAAESYKTNDTDLTAQLTKIKGNGPDVIMVWGTNPGPALAAKNMKQLGIGVPYVGSHGIANKTFIDLAGDVAEGVVFPAGRLLVPSSITDPGQKAVTDGFIAAYQAANKGESPNTFAGYAFESVSLLVAAIDRAGSTEPAAIRDALDATQNFPGPDGFYNYSPTNHSGLVAEDMIMVRIENGTWVLAD